jgi:hypothetical protein
MDPVPSCTSIKPLWLRHWSCVFGCELICPLLMLPYCLPYNVQSGAQLHEHEAAVAAAP